MKDKKKDQKPDRILWKSDWFDYNEKNNEGKRKTERKDCEEIMFYNKAGPIPIPEEKEPKNKVKYNKEKHEIATQQKQEAHEAMIQQRQGPIVMTIPGFKPNISSPYHTFPLSITVNTKSPYSIYGRNIKGKPIVSQPTQHNPDVYDLALYIKRKEESNNARRTRTENIKGPWPLEGIKPDEVQANFVGSKIGKRYIIRDFNQKYWVVDEKDLNERIRLTIEGRQEISQIRNTFYTGIWSNRYVDSSIIKNAGAFVRRKQLIIKSRRNEVGTRFTVDPYFFLSNLNKENFREYFSGLQETRSPFCQFIPLYPHSQALRLSITNENEDLFNHLRNNQSNCKITSPISADFQKKEEKDKEKELMIEFHNKDQCLLINSQEGTLKSYKDARFLNRRIWNIKQNAMRLNWMGLYNDGIIYDHSTFRYYIAGMLDSGINFIIKDVSSRSRYRSKPVIQLSSYHHSGRIPHILAKLFMGKTQFLSFSSKSHMSQYKWQAIYSHADSKNFPAKLRSFIPFLHSSIRNHFITSFSIIFAIRSGWFHPNHFAFPIYFSLLSLNKKNKNKNMKRNNMNKMNILRPALQSINSFHNSFFHYPYRKEIVPTKAKLINQAFDPTMLTDPLYIMFGQKARQDMLARYEKEINEYYAGRPELRHQHEKQFQEHILRNKGKR